MTRPLKSGTIGRRSLGRRTGVENSPVTLVVRERIGAMSRYGKNLWPEDTRQPFPLEPVHWSRVGRLGDAVSLGRLDDAVETNLAFGQTTRSHHSSEEVVPRNGFKQSVACFFQTIPEQSPVGNTCWLVPAGAVGMPWTQTERNSATDHPCRPVELPALWNCKW